VGKRALSGGKAVKVTSKPLTLAVRWLRLLAAALPPRRAGFDPWSVHVGFVVDKVVLEQVLRQVIRFSPVNFIPPLLHYLEKDIK
jgi:hypothetical protein